MLKSTRVITTVLGPGILMAAAAIGASHLIQSTRAGADFGFRLLWLAILANVMKYPFFEFGQRYGAATGQTMLHGYRKLGLGYLLAFLGISCVTMVTSISALTYVTAALAQNLMRDLTGLDLGPNAPLWWSIMLVLICNGILLFGRYRALDRVTKFIVAILGITTIIAVIAAVTGRAPSASTFVTESPWTLATLPFLIALMGWMPAPIELSVWPSVWIEERADETGYRPNMREALIDFNTGYIACIVLAAAFLSLGALVMHPTGQEFDPRGPVFADQLVNLFRSSIGAWSGPVVAVAAFTTMFSTTLTCLDGYPRSNATALLVAVGQKQRPLGPMFWAMNLATVVITLVVVAFFARNLRTIVDTATIVAFLAAPLLAFLNLRLMLSSHMPREHRPGRWLLVLAWIGLAFLLAFGFVYVALLVGILRPAPTIAAA